MACGAAPSSLLLVRISPSVMTVKRPSARDRGPFDTFIIAVVAAAPARAPSGPAPPVSAGAVTNTAPSTRRRMAMNGMTRSLSGSAGKEILLRAAFEMIVDVEHALAPVGDRPPAGIFHQLGGKRAIGFVVEAGQAERLGHLLILLALGGGLLVVIGLQFGDFSLGARSRLGL